MRKIVLSYGLYAAWLVSEAAVFGSLYFSGVLGFEPCKLCWYQRILMYPLVIVLGIAAFDNNPRVIRYVLPLPVVGGLISVYHDLMQKVPGFAPVKPCAQGVPCQGQYINLFGFITIPFLALLGFLLITILLSLLAKWKQG
ncbi:disulfide oxidoreductase [Salibacterium halotolerans]|nr:disulfide oxidoreductase [Salibacterium halotolerans]